MAPAAMDFTQIRRVAITAIFSDDLLADLLALKGGNALSLVHRVSSRTSVDLDFSIRGDFEDRSDAEQRIFRALRDRFDSIGLVVFDERFAPKPQFTGPDEKPWWGGYEVSFKLIERERLPEFENNLGKQRINAVVTSVGDKRVFRIDLSKCEYTEGREKKDLDHFAVYVYTPAMIAIEKLRALCQQMPAYPHVGNKRARAQDFYDIYMIVTRCDLDLATEANRGVVRSVFEAKDVPLRLLGEISGARNFHRPDWEAVVASTSESLMEFDFYFDFVLGQVDKLQPLWME